MHHQFQATGPQHLYIELQAGSVDVTAAAVDRVTVQLDGEGADAVTVEQTKDGVSVVGPRRSGFFNQRHDVSATVVAPEGSSLVTKLGSAAVRTQGVLGEVRLSTGSGDVELDEVDGNAVVKAGSGSITARALGAAASVKAGSGDLYVGRLGGDSELVTGSGNIELGHATATVSMKTGSGDLTVRSATGTVTASATSGDLHIGRLERGQAILKNVSGDIRLGIPQGTPVWTDISTGTGRLRSTLAPTGAPQPGQDHVEVRARTLSGDIYLEQLEKETS
jgi:hypothetical protein